MEEDERVFSVQTENSSYIYDNKNVVLDNNV